MRRWNHHAAEYSKVFFVFFPFCLFSWSTLSDVCTEGLATLARIPMLLAVYCVTASNASRPLGTAFTYPRRSRKTRATFIYSTRGTRRSEALNFLCWMIWKWTWRDTPWSPCDSTASPSSRTVTPEDRMKQRNADKRTRSLRLVNICLQFYGRKRPDSKCSLIGVV